MYINCIIKLRRCIRREGKKTGRKGIYCQFSYLVNTCIEQNRIQVAVLAELGRIQWTWQNIAECGRLLSDCRRLPLNYYLVVGLFLLRRWKQVDVCKVLRRSPITVSYIFVYLGNILINVYRLYNSIYHAFQYQIAYIEQSTSYKLYLYIIKYTVSV